MEPAAGSLRGSACLAYEAMAPIYDDFTAHHDYEGWLTDLLKVLERHRLTGHRLLDVGCGTGKSFLPMLSRGWRVTGCDISPGMLALAEEKAGDRVELSVADMRELPTFGEFDLVWALDDAINYLLSIDELEATLRGMRANLASTGVLLFDVNELLVYRTFFAETHVMEQAGSRFVYRGKATKDVASGSICESELEAEPGDGNPADGRVVVLHRQKHFSEAEVLVAMDRAGLECVGVYGHGFDGTPRQPLDVSMHTKAIYVAHR